MPLAPLTVEVLALVEPAVTLMFRRRLLTAAPSPPLAPGVRSPPFPATFPAMSARLTVTSLRRPRPPRADAVGRAGHRVVHVHDDRVGVADIIDLDAVEAPAPAALITPLSWMVMAAPAPAALLTTSPLPALVTIDEFPPRSTVRAVAAAGDTSTVPVA